MERECLGSISLITPALCVVQALQLIVMPRGHGAVATTNPKNRLPVNPNPTNKTDVSFNRHSDSGEPAAPMIDLDFFHSKSAVQAAGDEAVLLRAFAPLERASGT